MATHLHFCRRRTHIRLLVKLAYNYKIINPSYHPRKSTHFDKNTPDRLTTSLKHVRTLNSRHRFQTITLGPINLKQLEKTIIVKNSDI